MIIPKLAIRNLISAGLRTWLNVFVLSLAYVAIIFCQGFYLGLYNQIRRAKIEAEIGGGQFWHYQYDPYDPFTFQNAHDLLPENIKSLISRNQGIPILILQGTFYPKGRIRTVIIKGIPSNQKILSIPTHSLRGSGGPLKALIGSRMAVSTGLKTGDIITVQWQDAHGTFDAQDVEIVEIMNTPVPTIDHGQIWVPLEPFQKLTQMTNHATMVIMASRFQKYESIRGWRFHDLDFLLKDLHDMRQTRTIASSFLYGLLIMLAMLAIFDTQILSVFKRQKEIGTLVSLGMTRNKVIQLFTVEGILYGILAVVMGAIYGFPLLKFFSQKGFSIPETIDRTGYALSNKVFPIYNATLIFETVFLVLILTAIVSYLPTRKITKLKPTDALRGKLQTK